MVEVEDFVDPLTGKDSAKIDRVWTKGKTKCESKGKVKFFLNNSSDIDVTVILTDFQARAGGVCTGVQSGTADDIPIEATGVKQVKLTAGDQGDAKDKKRIRDLGTGVMACYKFDVYLYKKGNTNPGQQIDFLDPDLEIGPPSGPPPGVKGGK